jgi:hypothetical protein
MDSSSFLGTLCIFAKMIHMNLAVKFNLLKDTQPHYIYKPESCLENDNYKLYFDRTVLLTFTFSITDQTLLF